jgi:hypothetical protein
MNLSFHDRKFKWTLLLADIQLPIIGTDFLRHFRLVVNLAAGQLLDTRNM